MQVGLVIVSQAFGLIPLNYTKRKFHCNDYIVMFVVSVIYFWSYLLVNIEHQYTVRELPNCNSICSLGNSLFIHLGVFVYSIDFSLSVFRGKYFFPEFYERLDEIDDILKQCQRSVKAKVKVVNLFKSFLITVLIGGFVYAIYYDVDTLYGHFGGWFVVATMTVTFPFVASSIVQAQFIFLVTMISERFDKLNFLLDSLNRECAKKNIPIQIFDIESEATSKKWIPMEKKNGQKKTADESEDDETSESEEELENVVELPDIDCKTSEECLADLFQVHDKILSLSKLTNHEFGSQVVPYMAVCFVISIFGIFLETKVIFIVGGRNALLDYVAHIYVIWSLITIIVAYLVLRLCCNANGHSRQSAMIVHEIMQKKPPFMMGNDTYYNKMKSFTLQYLHWEGYFQFNGIGMFALDYTFIFSTVSAATSYLIVLLQFDMSAILKNEGLTE